MPVREMSAGRHLQAATTRGSPRFRRALGLHRAAGKALDKDRIYTTQLMSGTVAVARPYSTDSGRGLPHKTGVVGSRPKGRCGELRLPRTWQPMSSAWTCGSHAGGDAGRPAHPVLRSFRVPGAKRQLREVDPVISPCSRQQVPFRRSSRTRTGHKALSPVTGVVFQRGET